MWHTSILCMPIGINFGSIILIIELHFLSLSHQKADNYNFLFTVAQSKGGGGEDDSFTKFLPFGLSTGFAELLPWALRCINPAGAEQLLWPGHCIRVQTLHFMALLQSSAALTLQALGLTLTVPQSLPRLS